MRGPAQKRPCVEGGYLRKIGVGEFREFSVMSFGEVQRAPWAAEISCLRVRERRVRRGYMRDCRASTTFVNRLNHLGHVNAAARNLAPCSRL